MFEQQQLVVSDVRSPVLLGGPKELEASDEAVVFVHGNPDSGGDWEPLMSRVADFARVIAPDMPGFGGAERRADQDYTVAGYAAHLDGLLNQLKVNKAHVVAHDIGGPMALTWCAEHPDRVASITLIDTGVPINYRWHRMARLWRLPVIGELVLLASTPMIVRAILRHENPNLPKPWVNRIANHLHTWGTKRAVLRYYRSTDPRAVEALRTPLRQLNIPALVVWGGDDVYVPAEQAERQRLTFPDAQIHVLPGVGHWPWLEQPQQVADLLIPFLRKQIRG